ncbi:hypothetical protein FQR65_LT07975 [Abscondita terminalis]|nr:hypothetical protein FQR65_LT07975 [Abscondita terminalis]
MVVHPPGFGGGIEGDPAPGRSPGPPEILVPLLKTVDEVRPTTVLLTSNNVEQGDCLLKGDVVEDPHGAVNFSINHQLFKSDLIVPGIIYQAFGVVKYDPDGKDLTECKISKFWRRGHDQRPCEPPECTDSSKADWFYFENNVVTPTGVNWRMKKDAKLLNSGVGIVFSDPKTPRLVRSEFGQFIIIR